MMVDAEKDYVRTVIGCRIWKAGPRFICSPYPRDNTGLLLRPFVNHVAKATPVDDRMNFTFRTTITQWSKGYIVLTLPKALNDTWERLWREGRDLVIILTIENARARARRTMSR